MRKRPLILTIIALIHFLYPAFYLGTTQYFHGISFAELPSFISVAFSPLHKILFFIVIVSAIFVGYGIWKVRLWAYWGFFVYAFFTLVLHISHYYSFSQNDLIPLHLDLIILLLTIGIIFYFIRKHIKAPYFNPRLRWWENDDRYKVKSIEANLTSLNSASSENFTANLFDLSTRGLFIVSNNLPELGSSYKVQFELPGFDVAVSCSGKVVRTTKEHGRYPSGFGLMFTSPTSESSQLIKKYIASLDKDSLR